MESPQNIKKRLKSVKNINQITKAMELVSATKMRKSQQIALDSRPYAFAALDFLATVSNLDQKLPELFEVRKNIKKVLFVLVTSDKGLAGAFNSSIFRKFEAHLKAEREEWKKEEHIYVAVGEKSYAYLTKKGFKVVKKFTHVGDHTTTEQVKPLSDFLIKGYLNKDFDRVIVISTHFKTALKQEAHVRRVLPIDFDHIADTIKEIIPERGRFADLIREHNLSFAGLINPVRNSPPTGPSGAQSAGVISNGVKEHHINFIPDKQKLKEYTIEPSPDKVLEKLAEHLFFMQVYHLILEANASEHSARRLAMKTASDNASDLGEALNLQYNKSRQSRITTEIAEISAGAEAQNS